MLKIILLAVFVLGTESLEDPVVTLLDYYWREYLDEIPIDAFPVGYDANNDTIYLGQGLGYYSYFYGNVPAPIYYGETSIVIPLVASIKVEMGIKILCSTSRHIRWVKSSTTTFYQDMLNKYPILGGLIRNYSSLKILPQYIGRGVVNGKTVIGRINTNDTIAPLLAYVGTSGQLTQNSFEVLVFQPYF